MKIRPLQDWAVIRRTDPEEMTSGGIIIPDMAKDKPSQGVVISIGPGTYELEKGKEKEKKKKFVPTVIIPGQRIMFVNHRAEEFELDGEKITIVRERDILGTIEGKTQLAPRASLPAERPYEKPVIVKEKFSPMHAPVKKTNPEKKSPRVQTAQTKSGKTEPAARAEKKKEKKPGSAKKQAAKKQAEKHTKENSPLKGGAKAPAEKTAKKNASAKSKGKIIAVKTAKNKPVVAKKTRTEKTVSKKKTDQKKTGSSPAKKKMVKKPVKKTTAKKQVGSKKTALKTPRKGKR